MERITSTQSFLKDLPCRNPENFSLMHESVKWPKRLPQYVSTEDNDVVQTIVLDRRHLLLRYLDQKKTEEQRSQRRKHAADDGVADSLETTPNFKRVRLTYNEQGNEK